MNKQKLFNDVVAGFRAQNWKRSYPEEEALGCAYRGRNNTKCAIGWLIPDKLYSPQIEGITIVALLSNDHESKKIRQHGNGIAKYLAEKYGFRKRSLDDVTFLKNLQIAHDIDAEKPQPPSLQDALHEFAEQEHLTWPK